MPCLRIPIIQTSVIWGRKPRWTWLTELLTALWDRAQLALAWQEQHSSANGSNNSHLPISKYNCKLQAEKINQGGRRELNLASHFFFNNLISILHFKESHFAEEGKRKEFSSHSAMYYAGIFLWKDPFNPLSLVRCFNSILQRRVWVSERLRDLLMVTYLAGDRVGLQIQHVSYCILTHSFYWSSKQVGSAVN